MRIRLEYEVIRMIVMRIDPHDHGSPAMAMTKAKA